MRGQYTHANRELKVLIENTRGLTEINMSDKTWSHEGQLSTWKSFHAVLPDFLWHAASTLLTFLLNTITTQPVAIGQAGSAQLMAISLSARFPVFTSAHEMN